MLSNEGRFTYEGAKSEKHLSQTRTCLPFVTSFSLTRLREHFPQTTDPQTLQWCFVFVFAFVFVVEFGKVSAHTYTHTRTHTHTHTAS